jgi:hypothetical protein
MCSLLKCRQPRGFCVYICRYRAGKPEVGVSYVGAETGRLKGASRIPVFRSETLLQLSSTLYCRTYPSTFPLKTAAWIIALVTTSALKTNAVVERAANTCRVIRAPCGLDNGSSASRARSHKNKDYSFRHTLRRLRWTTPRTRVDRFKHTQGTTL